MQGHRSEHLRRAQNRRESKICKKTQILVAAEGREKEAEKKKTRPILFLCSYSLSLFHVLFLRFTSCIGKQTFCLKLSSHCKGILLIVFHVKYLDTPACSYIFLGAVLLRQMNFHGPSKFILRGVYCISINQLLTICGHLRTHMWCWL